MSYQIYREQMIDFAGRDLNPSANAPCYYAVVESTDPYLDESGGASYVEVRLLHGKEIMGGAQDDRTVESVEIRPMGEGGEHLVGRVQLSLADVVAAADTLRSYSGDEP